MIKTLATIGIRPSPDFGEFRKTLLREKAAYIPFYELFVNSSILAKLLGKPVRTRVDTVTLMEQGWKRR